MRQSALVPKCLLVLTLATAAFGQYKTEPAGPPPADLNPAVAATLQKEGSRITGPNGVVAEIWFRSAAPSGAKTAEDSVTLATVPQGALMGVIRFPSPASDRRGQTIKPGLYTMRFSMFPQNGDHQGVEPQRDFLLLVPAADDIDPNTTPDFRKLATMSMKASGTPHPAVFSIWKADTGFEAGLSKMGEKDWVLQTKVGDVPLAMIVVGQSEH